MGTFWCRQSYKNIHASTQSRMITCFALHSGLSMKFRIEASMQKIRLQAHFEYLYKQHQLETRTY